MIDTKAETLLTVKEARHEFPNRVSIPTLWRWMLKGARGVVLESTRIGGRRYTSKEACQRFIEACSNEPSSPKKSTQNTKRQSILNAKAILDEFGV